MRRRENLLLLLLMAPAAAAFAAFWLLPMARLAAVAGSGPLGIAAYAAILTNPRYFASLVATILLSARVTLAPLLLARVVVGFMVIMLAGRQGFIGDIVFRLSGSRLVFAYSMTGLFMGYLYFSIPRVILTVIAGAEKLDAALEEAARSLGAGRWRIVRDVIIPGLRPALISSRAICFSTPMLAFRPAFTLPPHIDVCPLTISTEFT